MRKTSLHSGQAFIELAIGMLVLALVLTTLFTFSDYIIRWLDAQRDLRSEVGKSALLASGASGSFSSSTASDEIAIDPFPQKHVFGADTMRIEESIHLPNAAIVR